MGHFQPAFLGVAGVGEGSFAPEEFALQEMLKAPQLVAIKGPARGALGVNGPGHQLLAGAGFPGKQHGGVALRHIHDGPQRA